MSRMEHFVVGSGPVPAVAQGIARYRALTGMGPSSNRDFSRVAVDPVVAHHVARAYAAAPMHDDAALPHFKAMREEVGRQYDFMTKPQHQGGMGISVEKASSDPYVTSTGAPNSKAMMRDLHENNRIKVLPTAVTGAHPFFTNDENDMFRAVHDTFGHGGTGRNFSADGEEAAWRSHSQMFSRQARPAMTTETRGQNSVNNFGGLAPGEFAEQKIVTLGSSAQAIGRRSLHRALGRQFLTP